MSDFFLKNYEMSTSEMWTFLFLPVYSSRHFEAGLEATTWLGRSVHSCLAAIESIPYFGALWAVVERCLAWHYQHSVKVQKMDQEEDPLFEEEFKDEPQPHGQSVKDDLEARSSSHPLFGKIKAMPEKDPLDIQLRPVVLSRQSHIIPEVLPDYALTQEKATYQILTTSGFICDNEKEIPTKYGYIGEVQGSKELRYTVAKMTKLFLQSISPKALKEQRDVNVEQYLTIKIKRFAHSFALKGDVSLPSGKQVNLEGFCEAFTIPMLAASFENYAKQTAFFSQADTNWIVKHFNQTTSSDHVEPDDIQVLSCLLQDPNFTGPLSLGTGHHWHATSTIFFGPYVIYCNRGAGEAMPGIYIFTLADRSLLTEAVLWEMTKRQEIGSGEGFGSKRIIKDLGGVLVHYEPLSTQGAGNCTLVSMETALLVFMAIRQILNFYGEEQIDIAHCDIDADAWQQVFKVVQQEYSAWWNFDREYIFEDMIEEIQEWIDGKNASFSQHSLYDTYQQLLNCWYNKYNHVEPLPGKPFSGLVNLMLNKFF